VISVNYPKIPNVKLDDIISLASNAVPWVGLLPHTHSLLHTENRQCRNRTAELGDDPTKTVLSGGSAGAMLAGQVAYRFMSEGDYTSITGCILLFAVTLSWKYDGEYKHMYTAWEENGHAGTPVFGLELAKFIWCRPPINSFLQPQLT
jgi:hypothetical protein